MKSATVMGYIILIQSSHRSTDGYGLVKDPISFFTWRRAEFYFGKLILYLEEQILAH